MASGPLDGIRILEFSQIVALPFGGCIMSDLGADVIKVEALTGDPHRNLGAVIPKEGKRFHSLNRGKRSLAVDLQQPAGRELIYRLMPQIDVVTINFRHGVARRLGIDYEVLKAYSAGLIYCEMTGFGNRGPMAERAGTDIVASAYSGLMVGDQKIDDDGLPLNVTALSLADYCAGFSAAIGVSSALYHRALTGEGQKIETSLLAGALAVQDTVVMREPVHDASNRDPMMEQVEQARARGAPYSEILRLREGARFGARSPFRGYWRAYDTKDGTIVLGALTPAGRSGARRVLGITDDPSDDADFDATDPRNIELAEALQARIVEQMRTRTADDWADTFAVEGVPVSPVHLPEEMADDPQVQAMGMMSEIEHPLTGRQLVPGPVVGMSATPPEVQRASPALGADTDDVLAMAGLDASEIEVAREAGLVL